jgi:putative SOS response-associated peptidase YedK
VCGRYASARSVDDIASAFGISDDDVEDPPAADWNVAPTKPIVAVVVRGTRRVLTSVRWGLVPGWAADPSIGARLINARIETVADKPAFRSALELRRCLLPADGWYEWAALPDGGRQPYYLTPADGHVLAFAGLWETWYAADGRPLVSATILTGPAPADLAFVHDRAPVVLPAARWDAWLDPRTTDAQSLATPTGRGVVVPHPVSDAVGDVRNNGPQLTERVEVPEQPALF